MKSIFRIQDDDWSNDPTIRKCIEILHLHGMIDALNKTKTGDVNALSDALISILSKTKNMGNEKSFNAIK